MQKNKKGPSDEVLKRVAKKLKAELESKEFRDVLLKQEQAISRQMKKCPVCKFLKVYSGPICPACCEIGYKVQPNGKIRRTVKKAKKKKVPEKKPVFHKCTNCDRELTDCEHEKGKGYCEECIQECFGEGVYEWPENEEEPI